MNEPNKLIVALDVDTTDAAFELMDQLGDSAGALKIGSQLFTSAGPEIVRRIISAGRKVFLDLKFHDIPNTVAASSVEAVRLGVFMFNVHAAGGRQMMEHAVNAVHSESQRLGVEGPLLIAVTVLTSTDDVALNETGITSPASEQVSRLANLSYESGLSGVVASPREITLIRGTIPSRDFIIVTPGVRPAGADLHDQKRVMTPAEAIAAGADYIVVGRPITAAPNPRLAAQQILEDIKMSRVPNNNL